MYKLFFIAITYIASSHAMITNPQYNPIVQQASKKLDKKREKLHKYKDVSKDPSCKVIDYQYRGVCFNYAFRQLFQITEPLKIVGCRDWVTDVKGLDFLEQIEQPKKNCLVAYTLNEKNLEIEHVGIVANDNPNNTQIKSKWGVRNEIIEHPLFTIPKSYGDAAYFFDVKQEYTQALIFEKIQKNISQANNVNTLLAEYQRDLYRLIKGKKTLSAKFPAEFTTDLQTYALLKKIIGIDINGRDKKNKTPLMLAAERGNLDLVELLIAHGANKNLRDSQDKTAAQLALENGHIDIVRFLRQKKLKT